MTSARQNDGIDVFLDVVHELVRVFLIFPQSDSYKMAPVPPTANEKRRLSKSNLVCRARSKRVKGSQYAGTKKGSVNPSGAVRRLTRIIFLRVCGFSQ